VLQFLNFEYTPLTSVAAARGAGSYWWRTGASTLQQTDLVDARLRVSSLPLRDAKGEHSRRKPAARVPARCAPRGLGCDLRTVRSHENTRTHTPTRTQTHHGTRN